MANWRDEGPEDCFMCSECGKYTQFSKKGIEDRCSHRMAGGGKNALSRVARGLHPNLRSRATVVGCTDVRTGTGLDWGLLAPCLR